MKLITAVFLITMFLTSVYTFAGTESEEYQRTAGQLQQALENRDYKGAKVSLNELLPLMKEDIKECKKSISEAKKSDTDSEVLSEMKATLKRKSEIYDSLEHLLTVSPAAIRVRAKQVITIVGEFEELSASAVASL